MAKLPPLSHGIIQMVKLCRRCGNEREPENAKQACCKECRKLERAEASVKRRELLGLRPWGQSKTQCGDCEQTKEDPRQTYCNPCRRKRNKAWALSTGRIKSHKTGLCPCGAERAPHQQRFCSACKAADSRKYRAIKGYTEKDKATRKIWARANRAKIKLRMETDPLFKLRITTRAVTNRYIKSGILIKQPCEVCGVMEKVEAHHDDYTKPMDVRWLCRSHHAEHHRLTN